MKESTSEDKFVHLKGLLKTFSDELFDQMKMVLSSIKLTRRGGHQWKMAKEAKGSVDRLYRSAGELLKVFGDKDRKIDHEMVM